MFRLLHSPSGGTKFVQSPGFLSLFMVTMLAGFVAAQTPATDSDGRFTGEVQPEHVHPRTGLSHFWQAVAAGKARVAFMGGSITEMEGYRPQVMENLRRAFPQTEFESVNAGISSTCSTTGAFRVRRDVLDQGPVDLLLVEFAVNDDQDAGHSKAACLRGMEGIVRHLRRESPATDIAIVYFVNPALLKAWQSGQTPLPIEAHEQVAEHYGIPSINVTAEVASQMAAGNLTWEQYGGVHPNEYGNSIAARLVAHLLERTRAFDDSNPARAMPAEPVIAGCFDAGEFVDPELLALESGWELSTPAWEKLPGACRERFRNLPMLWSETPGATFEARFQGNAVGLYVLAGPDAGTLEFQVDDGDWDAVDLKHHYSANLHYPRTVMLATNLPQGEHRIRCRLAPTGNSAAPASASAARIVSVVVNGHALPASR